MSSWVGVQCRFQSDLPADAVRVVTNIHIPKRGLGGTLPKAFGMLRHLRELDMDHDNYHGPLPPEWGCLKDLKELDLAGNPGLSGEIPPEVRDSDGSETRSFWSTCTACNACYPDFRCRSGATWSRWWI